jgi:Flp pilus assembly protein TadD
MQGRRYGEAAEVYKQAIELSPSDADLRSKLGLAYAAMGEGERAKREYERALKVNPASLNARNYLGAYFMQKSLWEQAVEQFQEVIRLAPEHADARNNLGISYYQLGKVREAEAELRKALALRPGSKEIKENLEKVTTAPAATSLARLEQEVRSQADSARAHYELGSAYGNMGELEKASREFAIALRLDPRNPVIHYAIGVLHYTKGERDQAQLAWQRAIRLDPTFGPARERLAELRATGPAARRGP